MIAPGLRIRKLNESDYPALLALWRDAGLVHKPAGRDSAEAFAAQLAEQGEFMLAAEMDSQLAGVVIGSRDGRKGWANRVAVAPAFRRRGIAEALLHALDQVFEQHGIKVRSALIFHTNAASRHLFEKCGYTSDEHVAYYSKRTSQDD